MNTKKSTENKKRIWFFIIAIMALSFISFFALAYYIVNYEELNMTRPWINTVITTLIILFALCIGADIYLFLTYAGSIILDKESSYGKNFSFQNDKINSQLDIHKKVPNNEYNLKHEGYLNIVIINEDLQHVEERLDEEIIRLNKSATINFIIGSVGTFIAIVFLAYEVYIKKYDETTKNMTAIIAHYIPRVSFVVFTEIFAFFFLKVYSLHYSQI